MKIAIADHNSLKFCQDLKEHWEKLGHEVKYETGASEFLAQWADLYYIDTWDQNLTFLYNCYHGQQEINPNLVWDNNKKPIIVVRALDWEVWLGLYINQEIIDWVDKVICIAPHIEKKLRSMGDWGNKGEKGDKIRLIRPGVNLKKFTLKSKKTDGFQLGMVLGDMWWPKNHMAGLDIFTTLHNQDTRWKLHIRGQHEPGEYWKVMYDYYLDSRGIREAVTLYEPVENMNEWLENIDILLHPGMKEAFCYAIGEAMAKGIPAVVNDFYGSKEIWPKDILYQTHNQAVKNILEMNRMYNFGKPDRKSIRQHIEQNYSLERQLKETDEWLEIN